MADGVSIKVCVRCRPFTKDDQLGVKMTQVDEENGEVELLNSKYSTTRFGFSYSWWSAYGYNRHITGPEGKGEPSPEDLAAAEEMTLVNQEQAYATVGTKVYNDLMSGNSVVLFAYGLSGSGKTFTVFGPDAPDIPEAWYKHSEPHPLWGIFPQLAYEVFKKKEDGWKVTMKYFQNVVDTVRDLMSPMAKEMSYKTGMKKDKDGFMDIDWCESAVLETWDDLRKAFMAANARKAIAPTQFNHQSTRGHCIMTLEVEMPHPTVKGTKQRGRVYVCDLAGTEPAGDIVYANYKKIVYENGDIEHKYLGPHPDQSKTKQLQDQGKKINLSLSEMANFFLKMAKAVQEKKLKPGQSIPGCNTYFLSKFLKDTILISRSYLFTAIRPEVSYLNYTFATLQFAKNASVIKLQPKKATSAQSKREMQLMEELEKMKSMIEELKKSGGGGGGGLDMEEMNRMLADKQAQLVSEMKGEADKTKQQEMEKQKQQYSSRGIALSWFEPEPAHPHLVNLDEDSFRDRRFLFIFEKESTVFGRNKGDIQPLNMDMVDEHCTFEKKGPEEVYLVGGEGSVYHNGKMLEKGERIKLEKFDRVVIGTDIMLFRYSFSADDSVDDEPDARSAIQEYHQAARAKDSAYQEQARKLEEDKRKLQEELERMKREGSSDEDIDSKKQAMEAWKAIDETMLNTVPILRQMEHMCAQVGRDMLEFKLSLQHPREKLVPDVKVQVTDTETNTVVFLDPFEIQDNMNILKDQIQQLKWKEEPYEVPADEEIVKMLFDSSYQIGTCTNFLLHCTLCMETDEDESTLDLMKSVIPYDKIGELEVFWKPRASPDSEERPDDIDDPSDLLGKSWTYKIEIGSLSHLATPVAEARVEFEFYGQRYSTEAISTGSKTREVNLAYSEILHVEKVDQEFLDYLDSVELKFEVFIKPWEDCKLKPLSNRDPVICRNLGLSLPEGAEVAGDPMQEIQALKAENAELRAQLDLLRQEKYEEAYKKHVALLEERIASLEANAGKSKALQKLEAAKETDSALNNGSYEE
ncbi:Kinesin-like protein [Hondaea fermentalgiana]|uniref:Kinesin-like protein n=1 Tax=Hondaea fermentalgiana TaxID=2315210 RepID=A0A2R5GM84_9STRA|nr:Kinesin-like protein [Hondaea fermentalgiana]|eukprot:GBG29743.1 Kinesin-like protein [Hondaea fermentalgiana]